MVTFDGRLQAGPLAGYGWGVRRLNKRWSGLTAWASDYTVTVQKSFEAAEAGVDLVSYNDLPHDFRAYDGRHMQAFTFYG